jgi:hypothetical protein
VLTSSRRDRTGVSFVDAIEFLCDLTIGILANTSLTGKLLTTTACQWFRSRLFYACSDINPIAKINIKMLLIISIDWQYREKNGKDNESDVPCLIHDDG